MTNDRCTSGVIPGFQPNYETSFSQVLLPQLIVQGVPNWSTNTPNRAAHNDSCSGICTVPPAARALKMRSAFAADRY